MSIQIVSDGVVVQNKNISLSTFVTLVERHLASVAVTQELEAEGEQLQSLDFPKEDIEYFIRRVCKWGGYAGIAGRILKQNNLEDIRVQFANAVNASDAQIALENINQIKQLGSPSFASKHLRFLRPDVCPVLDSIISDELGYAFNSRGYKLFSDDCLQIAEALQTYGANNPVDRDNGKWFAADVEMGLFAYLRGW